MKVKVEGKTPSQGTQMGIRGFKKDKEMEFPLEPPGTSPADILTSAP